MKKVLFIMLCSIFMISASCVSVFAAYNPAGDSNVAILFHKAFYDAGGSKVEGVNSMGGGFGKVGAGNVTKVTTIKPGRAEFRYGIIPRTDGNVKPSSNIRKGTNQGLPFCKKYAKAMSGNDSNIESAMISTGKHLYWFKAADYPEVEYRGYQVYDNSTSVKTYVPIVIRAKLMSYSESYKCKGASDMKTPAIAFANVNSNEGQFAGLPTVIINCIGNARVQYTFYKAKSDGSAGDAYPVKSNATYDDIDCYQAISIYQPQSAGFAATTKAQGNLRFGDGGNSYWATNSNAATQRGGMSASNPDWDAYAMNFYLNKNTINMLYTSNQRKIENNKQTKKVGLANGSWSYFSTSAYSDTPTITLDDPKKEVYDSNSADDVDKTNHTHNFISSSKDTSTYYLISQPIPKGMNYNLNYYRISRLTFSDKLDSCFELSDDVKIYKNSINGADITNQFTNNSNGKTIKFTSKDSNDARKAINLDGQGGNIVMKIPVKLVRDGDELENHMSDNLTANNSIHINRETPYNGVLCLDVPNEASVERKVDGTVNVGNNSTRKTAVVNTRTPVITKHNLIIKKQVNGENPDTTKKFQFTVTLNSGAEYQAQIKRADKSTENLTFKSPMTYELADGDTLTIFKIAQDIQYSVTERGEDMYKPSYSLSNPGNCLETGKSADNAGDGENLSVNDVITRAPNYDDITYTFTNVRKPLHHDISVKKIVESNETTKQFSFTMELTNLTPSRSYSMRTGSSNSSQSSDADGNMTVNFKLKDGQTFTIYDLPDFAKYKVSEAGEHLYKARFEVVGDNNGQYKVTGRSGSGELSQGVSTPEETLQRDKEFGDYNIEYEVYNDNRKFTDIVIGKKSDGTGAKKDDEFTYKVSFSNIPSEKNGKYKKIAYEIYTELPNGKKRVTSSIRPVEGTSNSYTEEVSLKAGQFISFSNILDGTTYTIKEEGNDYTASYKGEGYNTITNEALPKVSDSNSAPYTDLSLTHTIPTGVSSKMTYIFTNVREKEPVRNHRLRLSKVATDGTEDPFNFTMNLAGLEKNHDYALCTKEGDTVYKLTKSGNHYYVRSGAGTTANPYVYVYGVPIELTRADGEKKIIYSDRQSANPGNFNGLQSWIDYKGGSYTVSWIGGNASGKYTGTITSFTSDNNGRATVNFTLVNDEVKYLNGIPQNATYNVSEPASKYKPSYITERNDVIVDQNRVKENTALSTKTYKFDLSKQTTDMVTYTNELKSYNLKTVKKEEPNTGKKFDFLTIITNLTKDRYMVAKPGDGNFKLTMAENGDITLTATGYSGSIEDIPIKLIRPADKASKIYYTNSAGKIPVGTFQEWLVKDQDDAFEFEIEWNGGHINGTFAP